MTIENGWYVASCSSEIYPFPSKNLNTVYAPYDIELLDDDDMYYYKELRCNLPVDYTLPDELIPTLADALNEVGANADGAITALEAETVNYEYQIALSEIGE